MGPSANLNSPVKANNFSARSETPVTLLVANHFGD
jgi:hypothetical protein